MIPFYLTNMIRVFEGAEFLDQREKKVVKKDVWSNFTTRVSFYFPNTNNNLNPSFQFRNNLMSNPDFTIFFKTRKLVLFFAECTRCLIVSILSLRTFGRELSFRCHRKFQLAKSVSSKSSKNYLMPTELNYAITRQNV